MINYDLIITTEEEGNNNIQSGNYYIIDPYYILNRMEGIWQKFINQIKKDQYKWIINIIDEDDIFKIFIFSTKYGEGCYPVYNNDKCLGYIPIDSTFISIMPKNIINNLKEIEIKNLMVIINIEISEDIVIDDNRDIFIGKLKILTSSIEDKYNIDNLLNI